MTRLLLAVLVLMTGVVFAGLDEEFLLTKDKEKFLTKLLPKTRDYYYYRALHYWKTRQIKRLKETLNTWRMQADREEERDADETTSTEGYEELKTMLAVHSLSDKDNLEARHYLCKVFGLDNVKEEIELPPYKAGKPLPFADEYTVEMLKEEREEGQAQQERNKRPMNRPEKPDDDNDDDDWGGDDDDPEERVDLSMEALLKLARKHAQVEHMRGELLTFAVGRWKKLSTSELGQLLKNPFAQNYPEYPAMLAARLTYLKKSNEFEDYEKAFDSRFCLSKEQLGQLVVLLPELKDTSEYLRRQILFNKPRHAASAEMHARYARTLLELTATRESRFDKVRLSAMRLRLLHEVRSGTVNEKLFEEFLRLRNRRKLDGVAPEKFGFRSQKSDSKLVNDCLRIIISGHRPSDLPLPAKHYLIELFGKSFQKRCLKTMLLCGKISVQEAASHLDAQELRSLINEKRLRFTKQNPSKYGQDDNVTLHVAVKNVPALVCRVYPLNTWNIRRHDSHDSPHLPLDGLQAHSERRLIVKNPPQLEKDVAISLPQLKGRGLWVVEVSGESQVCRALVRKGTLDFTKRETLSGYEFRAFDEKGVAVERFEITMGERAFRAEKGRVLIPYNNRMAVKQIIVSDGKLAKKVRFEHGPAKRAFRAKIRLERESVIAGRQAVALIRPDLRLNDLPLPFTQADKGEVRIIQTNDKDERQVLTLKDLRFRNELETAVRFKVMERVRSVRIEANCEAWDPVKESHIRFQDTNTINVNKIGNTLQIASLYLERTTDGYRLLTLGRNGEPVAKQELKIELLSRLLHNTPIPAIGRTDRNGVFNLGTLANIQEITVDYQGSQTWTLDPHVRTLPRSLRVGVGETTEFALPTQFRLSRGSLTLRADAEAPFLGKDFFSKLKIGNGILAVSDLPVGEYRLRVGEQHSSITVARKSPTADYLAIDESLISHHNPKPIHVAHILDEKRKLLTITLGNQGPNTRVHVLATRFLSHDDDSALDFPIVPWFDSANLKVYPSSYAPSQRLSSEQVYIRARKYAKVFPGVMLPRPGLILNPKIYENTKDDSLDDGGMPGGRVCKYGGSRRSLSRALGKKRKNGREAVTSDLGFLKNEPIVLANLKPDKNGKLVLDLKKLVDQQLLSIVVVSDNAYMASQVALPLKEMQRRDLRMTTKMSHAPPHILGQAQSIKKQGDVHRIKRGFGRYRIYSSLQDVSGYCMLRCDYLDHFAFILDWPKLSEQEKLQKYGQNACHELAFFIYRKDRAFFNKQIRPHLANKLQKTFLDEYLLGKELGKYCAPARFQRLNTVEKILLAKRLPKRRADILRHLESTYQRNKPLIELHARETLKAALLHGKGDSLEIETVLEEEEPEILEEMEEIEEIEAEVPEQKKPGRHVPQFYRRPGPSSSGPNTTTTNTPILRPLLASR